MNSTSSPRCPGTARPPDRSGWRRALVPDRIDGLGFDHPGAPVPGRRQVEPRATGARFRSGFSALAGVAGPCEPVDGSARCDVVLAMSPPLTLGPDGPAGRSVPRAPLVFNIQDVFPDAAVRTGAITNRAHHREWRSWLERFSYHRSAAITVLSEDLRENVGGKMSADRRESCPGDPELRRHRGDLARSIA